MTSYTYDFADRPRSLSLQVGGGGPQRVVDNATYHPSGPLTTLNLANGLAETRTLDDRYSPNAILLPDHLGWIYTTDDVGDPTAIIQTAPIFTLRSYGYQDVRYYQTLGAGPWLGPLSCSYDRIVNRLTETRGALTDTYDYLPNSGGGRTAALGSITLGTRDYTFGPAGHLEQVAGSATSTTYGHAPEGRLTCAASA